MTTTAANTWCSRHGISREYHHQFDGITLTEFDVDTMKLKPETARTIWDGTGGEDHRRSPPIQEMMVGTTCLAAEGGTVYEHQESVARSHTIDEYSFEVMRMARSSVTSTTPDTYLQKQGHGALVDTRPASGITPPYAVVRGVMIPNRLMAPADGAHSDARPPSRKSNG